MVVKVALWEKECAPRPRDGDDVGVTAGHQGFGFLKRHLVLVDHLDGIDSGRLAQQKYPCRGSRSPGIRIRSRPTQRQCSCSDFRQPTFSRM